MVQERTQYRIKADWMECCNCDPGCNCNFGGFPDHGNCEGLIGISINEGNLGDVDLSGVKAVLALKWPAAIHDGNGTGIVFVDDSATQQQVESLATVLTVQAGGLPWEILATTLSSVAGPLVMPIQMNVDGRNSGFKIDGILEAKMTPLKNPVTGEENDVHITFPNGGLIWNDGDSATTSILKVDYEGITFDHSGQSGIFASVEWSN